MQRCLPVSAPQPVEFDNLFDAIWDASPDALLLVEDSGSIEMVNQHAHSLFEYEECDIAGTQIEKLIPGRFHKYQDMRRAYMACPNEREKMTVENLLCLKNGGEEFFAEVTLRPIYHHTGMKVLVFVRDITERVELEKEKQNIYEQLLMSQKLSTLGHLAFGIAHDFNNVIDASKGYMKLIQERIDATDEKLLEYMQHINGTMNHATDLVGSLMGYLRKEKLKVEEVDPASVVLDVATMLDSVFPSSINISVESGDNLPHIKIVPSQLKQVLVNLCVNAKDAMPDGGKLKISVSFENIEQTTCSSCQSHTKGMYVVISVSDDGHGVDKGKVENIFRPLYTTKELGEGAGMGLSVINDIVHNSGGHIVVDSPPDCGTTFNIYLPAHNNTI